jgi:hypothetical protein
MSDMKIIMENWNGFISEKQAPVYTENPSTWGELAQNIMFNTAATKWPRIGKALARFGFKAVTSIAKGTIDAVAGLEDMLDFIPDEIQNKLEQGSEDAAEWLAQQTKQRAGAIGAFIVDDLIGMDDSLTTNVPGYGELGVEDEYENLIDKELLRKWAKGVMVHAKSANPDDPLPNLNQELEKALQTAAGAHPDLDEPDIRK